MSQDPFRAYESARAVEMLPGVKRNMLSCGQSGMVVRIDLAKGAQVPMHTHPHEQTGFLLSGRATLKIGEKAVELKPNDGYSIPGGIEHGVVDCAEDSVFVDVFSPPREEYRQ